MLPDAAGFNFSSVSFFMWLSVVSNWSCLYFLFVIAVIIWRLWSSSCCWTWRPRPTIERCPIFNNIWQPATAIFNCCRVSLWDDDNKEKNIIIFFRNLKVLFFDFLTCHSLKLFFSGGWSITFFFCATSSSDIEEKVQILSKKIVDCLFF